MKFQNFKVEDENDEDNAGFTTTHRFTLKLPAKAVTKNLAGTTQSLGNVISKKLQSSDHASNNENDDVFYLPTNKISSSVTSTSQTTNVNNGNSLELQTLFEPKEVITVIPIEEQSQLNFDDILEVSSSIVNDEDFSTSVSDHYYVTSSEILTSEHKQQSNNETLTTMPVEQFSVDEQTDNPSKTVSTLSSSNNDNGSTEKSDEFGVLETISFDQDLEEPAKITALHLTLTSSTPSSNSQIVLKLTSKELHNLDIITTTNNENGELLDSTTENDKNQVSAIKTNSYGTSTGISTVDLNSKTNNYGRNTDVVTHHPTNDDRVTVASESELQAFNFTDTKLGTWPELTSKNLDEIMKQLSTATDELIEGLPSKVLTDENMAISNTGLESTANPMEGNKESKILQQILITTNKLNEETQVKDNTNGEEVTLNELLTSAALAEEHGNLTSLKVTSKVENQQHISQSTHKMLNIFTLKRTTDEDMIPTQPLLATEEDILSKILETTHYPFISNKFKITSDENMILQELEKVNTESSTITDSTTEKLENILMTKSTMQEGTQLNESTNGDVVSEMLESTTFQTKIDEDNDLLTSNEPLTSPELTIQNGTTITSATFAKKLTQIIGQTSEVTGEVEKSTRGRFNEFMLKKTTNEDMVSSELVLSTEVETLLQVLKTTHNPFIENKLKISTDENMHLQELEKTTESNFELNTESSTVSALVTLEEIDTTTEKLENILMTQNNLQEGAQLNTSTIGNVVSAMLESTTFQTETDENKDLLTSNELLTSTELTTIGDNFPKEGSTTTLGTLSKEHDNVMTQIIGKTSEVTEDIEKTTRDIFNKFKLKKTTNEDMVSAEPVLVTESESLSQVLETTLNPFIENKLKITTDENMYLQELEKAIMSNFELSTESSTVSALVTLNETDTTTEKLEDILTTQNNFQEGTQLNTSTIGNVVSEKLKFTTIQTEIDENKNLLTSNALLTSTELTTIGDNFSKEGTTTTLATLFKEHDNVPTQIIGKTSGVTENIEKTTRNIFNKFMLKKTTNEDMVSAEPHLVTEIESFSQALKTTHKPFIENKLKITTDENMYLQELEKAIMSNIELNTESSTVSVLVRVDETDTTTEKLENILTTQNNLQEGTQLNTSTIGNVVSEKLKFTTIQTDIDENKILLSSNELLTSTELTTIGDNFPSNLIIKDGTTITLATLSKEHDNVLTQNENIEKTTRDILSEFMLKKTTNEDMASGEPVLPTDIESLSQVLKTTHNPFIENKLKITTDENMYLQELEKAIMSNFELSTKSSTVREHVTLDETDITTEKLENILTTQNNLQEGTQLNASTIGNIVSNELEFTSIQTHTDKNKNLLTSNDLLTSSEGTSIGDNFSSHLTITDGTTITLATIAKEHDNVLTHIIGETSKVTEEVEKITRERFNEFMLKKTTNEDMVSSELVEVSSELPTEDEGLSQVLKTTHKPFIKNKLKITSDENLILQEPEKTMTHFAENKESSTTSAHASQITTAPENSSNVITVTVKLPEENQFQQSTNNNTETESVAVITKNENKVWPDLTTTVEIAPHILTKTTIGLFNEFQFKDTTANDNMASIEPHSVTTVTKNLITTKNLLVVNQLSETNNGNILSQNAEVTSTLEGTTSTLLVTAPITKETSNTYVEETTEPSATLNEHPTLIEEITRSENSEHIATDNTHFKENTDLISKELKLTEFATNAKENINAAAKLKGEYTHTMEVLPHISKTTHSLLKNFLVEGITDEDMILQGPEKTGFRENIELSTEGEHALQTTAVGSLPIIALATTKPSEKNQFQEATNKFAENIITETTKNVFQEFPLEETNVDEDMTTKISRSTTTVTNLPHILETTSKIFEEITNEDMLSKESDLTTLGTTMEESNELVTSNLPITAEKVDTSEAKETSHALDVFSKESELHSIATNVEGNKETSTILNELLTLSQKPTQSEILENISATTELTQDIHFKESNTTNMVSEVPETTEIVEHISATTYNIFKIFEPQGNTDENMAVIEPYISTVASILPEILKITPNVVLENELKQTTNNEAISSADFEIILSTISTIENEITNNIKPKTETLPILSSNKPNAINILTESHENEFKSKATGISDLTTSNKIILNTHTIGFGTSVESLPHSPTTTIHAILVSSNPLESDKTTHGIDFSSTRSVKTLGLSDKTNAYTETTKESSNFNKEQSPFSSVKTNYESSLHSSSNPFPEHNQTSIVFEELTTKSYGNENGDWVTWPEINSTSEKNTVSTLITKLTISDLLTTENLNTTVTEIFQDVVALSTKSEKSSSETSPTLPDELQLDLNPTPIEHTTNLSTIENSLESTITPLAHNQMKETQLGGVTTPNLILSTISVKTHEPIADNQSKTTLNINFSSIRSNNNLETSAKAKEYFTSHETLSGTKESSSLTIEETTSTNYGMNSEPSLLSSSNHLQEKNETLHDFEELTTKSYGNENGDWVTWPEINSTSDKNTESTLLTKLTISDSVNTESSKFSDVTEIYQDAVALSTTSQESSSAASPTLPDELQLGFNHTPIEDSTNLLQITTAQNSFESIATTLNINSFSTTEKYHLKDKTNNILTNSVSPIGTESTFQSFNTKDQFNGTDHLLHKPKFEKTTATDMNVKSSGQMTTQFEYKTHESKSTDFVMNTKLNVGITLEVTSSSEHFLTIPTNIEPVTTTTTTINPLFTLTEDNIDTNNQTDITKTFTSTYKSTLLTLPEGSNQANSENTETHDQTIMHNPSEITDTYTSTLLKSTHVEDLSHSENLTLIISDEITQSNQVSIGSSLTNQSYQTEQHDTNLMHNSDETSETHISTLGKSTENSLILSHNETFQTESGNKLTSDLNLTSFATEIFLATTLSTPNRESQITENDFNTVSHEKVLEHTENPNNPTAEVIPHLELLDEEFMHFSTIGTHITTTSTIDKTTPNIHTTPSGDELLISHTQHQFLNSEDILAKQSEIIQNNHTTIGLNQGMVSNQIIPLLNTENQPLIPENTHSEFSESSHTTLSKEQGISPNELTHSVSTENLPVITVNIHPEFTESSHTTVSNENAISTSELTHTLITTVNAHLEVSESSRTTISAEHGISPNELTHSENTEHQPLTTANEHSEFSEITHTTLSSEHGILINELTHPVHSENQPITTVNVHPHLPESGHTIISAEQGVSPNELTHSENTEHQPLTTANEHPEFLEITHTTFSTEHGISITELTHSVHSENQPLTTVKEYTHLPESGHTTISVEHEISPTELTYSENTEHQTLTTAIEHPEFSESSHPPLSSEHRISSSELTHLESTGHHQPMTTANEHSEFSEIIHTTLSSEHGIAINELNHSAHSENQPLTNVNEHSHLPENGHTTITAEHGIPSKDLTHSENTEHQPLETANENLEFSQITHTTLSAKHGIPINELTHSAHTENQPLTTVNEHPYLPESGHTSISAEHGISPTELIYSENTEHQTLMTAIEHPEFSESSHPPLSSEHGISNSELIHLESTDHHQPMTTANEHSELSEIIHTTLSSEHGIAINELTHSAHSENQPLTNVNEHPHLPESGHTTITAEHGIPSKDLTHSENTVHQPLETANENLEFLQITHTTLSAEHGIPINELTHSARTENQPLTTVNEHPYLPESSHTISAEHGISSSELTHLESTDHYQPMTTANEHSEFSEIIHTTLSSEHGIAINELTHLAHSENQPLANVNEHPHFPESGHTTITAEHGIPSKDMTHSENTEHQPLATANKNLEFSQITHITLSAEHGISINELTHSARTENQPLTTVNEHPYLPESSHTISAEHGISSSELTHLESTDHYQPMTTANEHSEFSEIIHTTLSSEHGIAINELTHLAHSENQPLANVNEHPHFPESGHTTITAEHGIPSKDMTHSENTEHQPLATANKNLEFSQITHTTLSAEHGISINELTHSAQTENQPLTTVNEYPYLPESGHTTITAEHGIPSKDLTHSENTEHQPLATANENLEFSEITHTTLSSEHRISITELSHLAHSENQPLTTVNEHPHLSESVHTTFNAEHGISPNELTRSENTEHQPLTTANEHPEFSESTHTTLSSEHGIPINELIHSAHSENLPLTTVNEYPHFPESGHTTISAEHGISPNELTHSEHTEHQPLTTANEHPEFSEITHTIFSSEHGISINELTHSVHSENQPLTTVNEYTHLLESGHTTISAEHGISPNEVTHSEHTEHQPLTTVNAYPQLSDSSHTTFTTEHGISPNELKNFVHTENQPHTTVIEYPEFAESSHTTLSSDHIFSTNELSHSINVSHLTNTEIYQSIHATLPAELEISDNETSHLQTFTDQDVLKTTEFTISEDITKHSETNQIDHTTDVPKLEILDEELVQFPRSKMFTENTTYHTGLSTLPEISQNIHTDSHTDLGVRSSESPHLLHTATQLLSSETTEHQIDDNLHTSFGSTPVIHGSTSNDIGQNVHTTSHTNLGISSNEIPHVLNTTTQLLSNKNTEYHIPEDMHTGSITPTTFIFHSTENGHVLNNTDQKVLNSTEFTVFEDITKHFETNLIDHTTDIPKLEILDEELIQLPSKPFTENTTYHTEPSVLSDINQNVHTNFHTDLGTTSSELPYLLNTATHLLSSETSVHQVADNLHTNLESTPFINHESASNDIAQNIHTTLHADLDTTIGALPHLLNTATQLLSSETSVHQVADNLHTSLVSTPIIIHDLVSNDISQNIHTTSHADVSISSNELPHLVNTATTLLSTETTDHHFADNLHTSFDSTPITNHDFDSNNVSQNIHTNFHADMGITNSELSHLLNTATQLLSSETTEHQVADNLHTSSGSNDIDQNIHTTSHADLGISSDELPHLLNTATTVLSTETTDHHISDNLHTSSITPTTIVFHSTESGPVLTNTDQGVLNSTEFTVFENVVKHSETNEIDHTTDTPKLEILDEELMHLPSKFSTDHLPTSGNELSHRPSTVTKPLTSQNTLPPISSNELPHLLNTATTLLSTETTNHHISDNLHTSSITPTTIIFYSTESGPVLTNTDQGVLNSTEFTVFENVVKHSETNEIDHTTDTPKLEILDEELMHLPSKFSTDHLATSGNELSHRPSTVTKPLTSQETVPPTSDNILIGITSPSTLIVHNTDNKAKSNTENKFAHTTKDLARHSEVVHSNHNTLISTLGITSHDNTITTNNQQISDNHSNLVNPSTSIIPGTGNESKLLNTDKEFFNSTEFSVYDDLAKQSETIQTNQTTVIPKLVILDEEFIHITNKSKLLTEHMNHITNHTDLTTLPVTLSEFIPLPTITIFEQMFSDFINNNTLNYTKAEETELTTEPLKSTVVEISNQNLSISSEISNEHSLGTESSDISDILQTHINLVTHSFSHKETGKEFLKTQSPLLELQTLEFSHSTESFKENIKSFHKWLGQPSVNGTDQSTMPSHVNESTLATKTNSDMEGFSTNDLKHFSTLTHSTVSYFPNLTNTDSFHTSQHTLRTETIEPTMFPKNGAEEHQSYSNPGTLNTNHQGLDQKQTMPPVITTSTFAYSQNYHKENFTANEELPNVSVSQEMMSIGITTFLPPNTTTSALAYSHNYFPEDLTHNSISREIISSGIPTFPSSIISTETSKAKSGTSPNLSTTQSLAFHNKSSSTEMHNLGNFLKTDQAGKNKIDSGASSTKVSDIPTHESTENLSKPQNKTSGDTFHSINKNIDNNCSETSNLTINNFKTTGKEFEKNSTEGMWQWPGLKPENSYENSNSLAGDHAKITQPDVTIANAKFEPADNEILFTSKPNLSTTALVHVSTSPNLVTHVTHPKLQPEMDKNIPSVEIHAGQHNQTVGNTNLHQSNGTFQNAPIYINLPVYPVDSTYPLLLKFNEYYSSTTKSSVIIDDEATDRIINTEQFRTMKFEDFNAVTEFPSTTIKMEESTVSQLSHTSQILSTSATTTQPTTALNEVPKTALTEPHQQSVELTTKSEVTHVGKDKNQLQDVLSEYIHQNQQNAELTTKSETVHISSTEEKINQVVSNGVTEFFTVESLLGATHIENSPGTSSNTLNEVIGSEDVNKTTESSILNAHSQPVMIISEFPKFQEESTCNYTDYLSQNNCMCSMDNLIKDLRMKLVNNFLNFSIDNFTCPIFTHVEAGIFLGNDSVPHISKSRRDVMSDMYSIVVRRETVDYQNMDKTLNEQLELKNTENDIFATPGMKILIPCISSNNLSEGSTNYSWTFSDNLPLTEGKIQETEGTLTIDNVAPQDAGNYTCIATTSNANKSDEKRYEHHLSVVSIPSYRLQTTLLYNSTEKCQSGDADIISLYLPHSLEGLICGNYFKVCSIEVKNPKCLNATQYTSVNVTVIIEPINVIMPAINNSVCDVGCEMKIYTHVVLFIIKNLEAVLKLPVFFRLSYRQQKLMPTEVVIKKTRQKLGTEAPKLIITCPPGFGYYKKTHVCGTCGRNTFSRGDETFCSPCPAGQYQPMVGSKSCLICATPLQDPYCLRVMYSNTHKFRVLIGITATVLVVLIILLLCIKSMKKSTHSRSNTKFGRESYLKNKRQSRRRMREPDCEMQASQPLLDSSRDRKYKGYNRKPPEPPPPDFY